MAAVSLVFVFLLLVMVPLFIWWVLCLVEAVKVPDSTWAAADQSKLLYVLLMVLVGVLGTIVYVVVARPALRQAGATL